MERESLQAFGGKSSAWHVRESVFLLGQDYSLGHLEYIIIFSYLSHILPLLL